jgi:hypothetical protein
LKATVRPMRRREARNCECIYRIAIVNGLNS